MPDPMGWVVGMSSIVLLLLLLKHADAFSDGNVGADKE